MVNIRKRGKVFQYQFEIVALDGVRKYINKSGFNILKVLKTSFSYATDVVGVVKENPIRVSEVFGLTWNDIDLEIRLYYNKNHL